MISPRAGRSAGYLVVLLLAAPGAAPAQEAPLALLLSCNGSDEAVQRIGSTTTVTVTPGTPAPAWTSKEHQAAVARATASTSTTTSPVYGEVRVPAHLTLSILGSVVRVRPSDNTGPGLVSGKRSADGWYALSEVVISETQIQGKAAWGGLLSGKHRLKLDRITGDARFGSFSGVCEKAAADPQARKF